MPYITTPQRFGLKEGLLEGIATSLEIKFGAAALRLMPEIQQISEVELLKKILHGIRTAATLEEVRDVYSHSA